MLKIYGRTNSINVQKVMWAVGELALPHQRIDAGMAFGVVNEPEYVKMNPNRLVPTIDDDGVILWESNTIVRYLAAKHATGSIMPAGHAQRAQAEKWMDWQLGSIQQGMTPIFWNLIRTPPDKRDMKAVEAGQATVNKNMAILDGHLQGKAFMLGDALTVADIPLGCIAYRWYGMPIERPAFANVRAWYERLSTRPAYKQHVMLPIT
ncbi:MAG: glutathione S-transferase [Hyphomicrobiaceae bacterium]|nr:MAG: glutathione S-transferase [Hyphomicrobiaceae bacterium]